MNVGLIVHRPEKKCSKCGVEKLLTSFSRRAASSDELRSVCRTCDSDSQWEYYQIHRDEILERKRRYYEENREAIAEYKRRHRETMRDISREVATRNGKPWTPAEDAYILKCEETQIDMAVELGRTIAAVSSRLHILRAGGS